MYKPICGLARDGLPIIGVFALATLVFALLRWPCLATISLLSTIFSFNFFRDPDRTSPTENGIAVSPADGVVCKLGEAADPITGEMRQVVCVFMNVFNVHVNRSPVTGVVSEVRYIPGKFFNASLDKASTDNERNVIVVTDAEGARFTVVQIAGLIARRIVCPAKAGDTLSRGERYGMIKFGSRLDVYLPHGYHPAVAMGQKTMAGVTVLAKKAD
ncbi:phosphatidylserine decarboxylase family protein [Solidesulfovibrio magneticus]|uniref:Phosphatidylserine decarboxylase proenzyme n=1 Tax=Solidesulfovibrio magneticus (strain ATCC 700980 / DSM 13731 / RS-1) TaxID=573370 RepID=PSD_SOLM1|nr:phosphatidylserine decarboxylase family protein [Solidesulfovibrio magneticus]C4XPA6.1 RecName: Full=Phosphatidylserine decarboxylase proenzyme; Contains: RecName: Full=Phosphatidylserine decarboxylase alpha chain; Contains: RecName: Full=Phosphatidylserine decarboxylase beta chain [Solidesulfovibrio magneticus RS-1]BAH75087.1 phosphatidylserine decarboxylase proenzyme [Solidesulfovibrio magneticus RS-1]